MVRKHTKSFDLFSSYSNYLPQWKGMFVMLALMFVGALLGSLFFLLLKVAFPGNVLDDYQILIMYPFQFIPMMLYASAHSYKDMDFENEGGVPVDNGHFKPIGGAMLALMVAVGTIACAVVVEPICALLPEMPESIKMLMEQLSGGPLWVALLTTAVMAPFFEEWLCRGMILRGMLKRYSPATAIIISAAFFALIHLNPWQAIPAFTLGCLFGLVYYKTGSLKLTMLMHCANNTFSVLISRFPGVQGKDYIWQLFDGKWQYGIVYAVSAALLVLLVTRLLKTRFE